MAYVLFMDIVGFTRMPMDRQRASIAELQALVFGTVPYVEADAEQKVICRPTGDGMALVFFNTLLAPARCAVAVSQELKHRKEIRLRMGIHSGHVYRVQDALGNSDVIGEGINTAQRVMDCGDIGHILMSKEAAALMGNLQEWKGWVQDLGECPVKHGQKVHLFNLSAGDVGNRGVPKKVSSHRIGEVKERFNPRRYVRVAVLTGIAALAWQFGPKLYPSMSASAKAAWSTVFKSDAAGMLARSSAHADQKRWKESITEAKAALTAQGTAPEQRAEAYFRIISAYYHLGSVEKAAAATKSYKALADKLPEDHWTRGAIRWEPTLFAAREKSAMREWDSAKDRAETVGNADDSTAAQRAEAVTLLALCATRQGRAETAARHISRFHEIAPKLTPEHWTRAKIASLTPDTKHLTSSIRPAADPANAYFERVSTAYLRGDSAAAAKGLRDFDRFAGALKPEQLADLRRIAASLQLQTAREAFERGQYRAAITYANRALSRLDRSGDDDTVAVSERARALYYVAAAHLKMGERERAQRYIEIFSDRCAALSHDNPWSNRFAALQQTILNSISTDPLEPESAEDSPGESTESL